MSDAGAQLLTVRMEGWEIECCGGPLIFGSTVRYPLRFVASESADSSEFTGDVGDDGLFRSGSATFFLNEGPAGCGPVTMRGVPWVDRHLLEGVPPTVGVIESIDIVTTTYDVRGRLHTPSLTIPEVRRRAEPEHPWLNPPELPDKPVLPPGTTGRWVALSSIRERAPRPPVESRESGALITLRVVG